MYNKNIYQDLDNTMYRELLDDNYIDEDIDSNNFSREYGKFAAINRFCEGYKDFLSVAKTERLAVIEIEKLAKKAGFKKFNPKDSVRPGDKIYFINKNKNIILYILGYKEIINGMRILGAHIDSPRLDLKQNPLYEKKEFALFDTHYYGGIKKYQYVTTPLAIHGVVVKKDGTSIKVDIGEKQDDPIVGIPDLLIHLSQDQLQKTAAKAIEGEDLDVIVGSRPLPKEEKDAVKKYLMEYLERTYRFTEEDFASAELEVVPAGKARDFGLDNSMIASYGQDDRVCAYTSLKAMLDMHRHPEYTVCGLFVDKEEIGSYGATGAESVFFENTVLEILHAYGKDSIYNLRKALENSYMLSSDVNAAIDPIYASASDENNAAKFNYGIVFEKYTGARGKSGASDANPEYFAKIREVMDRFKLHYQTGELGAVDKGGGGTIAHITAKYNMEVIDAGVAVLNMHSPMEIVSKADVFETYLAYKAFALYTR